MKKTGDGVAVQMIGMVKKKYGQMSLFMVLGISICVFPYVQNTLYKIFVMVVSSLMILISIRNMKIKVSILGIVIPWFGFAVWSFLSFYWAKYDIDVNRVIVMTFTGAELFALGVYIDCEEKVLYLYKGILFGALMLVLEIVFFYGVDKLTESRMSNELLNSNRAGTIFSMSALLCLFILTKEKKKIYFAYFVILVVMIALTGSRTALLSLIASIVTYTIFLRSASITEILKGAAIALICVIAIMILVIQVPMFYNIIGRRFEETFLVLFGKAKIEVGNNSNYFRSQLYLIAFQLIKEHPLIGIGLDNFRYYNRFNLYAHTNYLEVFADLGIIGFTLFYFPFIRMCIKVKKSKKSKEWTSLIFAYILYFLLTNLTAVSYNQIFDITIMGSFYYLVANKSIGINKNRYEALFSR